MITDELVSFETAKLAKEKGFDVPTDFCYEKSGNLVRVGSISAPTQSLLQRWLREGKNLYISIIAHAKSKSVYYEWEVRYISALGNMNKASSVMTIETYRYNTYELALEDALKYALENLV